MTLLAVEPLNTPPLRAQSACYGNRRESGKQSLTPFPVIRMCGEKDRNPSEPIVRDGPEESADMMETKVQGIP